jgi:VIT1/CCC1 family predicted Fe2+/Mn2+ transporter
MSMTDRERPGVDRARIDQVRGFYRITRRFSERRGVPLRPHAGPVPHPDRPLGVGGRSGALRAGIFGMNDGLLSNLSLIMGVAGATVANRFILLAGVAGLLAGAFSMAAGEYVSMRVQRELFERLLHIEAHELATEPEEEHQELQRIYEEKGFPSQLARQVTEVIMQDPEVALETHAREELGLDPSQLGSPWGAAISSFLTFGFGAAIPLVPFVVGSGTAAAVAAISTSAIALLCVGAVMSILTGRSAWASGGRMLLVGTIAASVTFGVGRLLHASTGV